MTTKRGRPPAGDKHKLRFTLNLDPDVVERVEAYAQNHRPRLTKTAALRTLINHGLARPNNNASTLVEQAKRIRGEVVETFGPGVAEQVSTVLAAAVAGALHS
jgi:hypothetical protein